MTNAIPTLEELKAGTVVLSPLQTLLESEPLKEWLKVHPSAKNEKGEAVYFLPIERIDYLLRSIYSSSWTEITQVNLTQHSIQVTVRLFVLNPETKRVEHVDGIGAATSRHGIEAAAPIAESLAKKNAAKKLGKLFGRDISREIEEPASTTGQAESEPIQISEMAANPVRERIIKQIEKTKTPQGLKNIIKAAEKRAIEGELSAGEVELITLSIDRKIKALTKI